MMKFMFFLLIVLFNMTLYGTSPTTLKHNELQFANGTGFVDEISPSLPVSIIPSDVSYDEYLSYVYGFSVFDIGSVSVSGGAGVDIFIGDWVGEDILNFVSESNYFSGIEGLTTDGREGVDSTTQNAYSEIQVSKTLSTESLWLRANTNDINQIDAFSAIDAAFEPYAQVGLALQAEAGDVSINNVMLVENRGTARGRVGIGTQDPSSHLHVNGDVKVTKLLAEYGQMEYTAYVDEYNHQVNEGELNLLYNETFNTNDWESDMEGVVFFTCETDIFRSTGGNDHQNLVFYTLFIFDEDDMFNDDGGGNADTSIDSIIHAESITAGIDYSSSAALRSLFLFTGATFEKNKTYRVQVAGRSSSGADGERDSENQIYVYHSQAVIYAFPN